jgi:6-pyruvoyl tetrahydropterin synthase/QueD family protein
VTAVGPIGLHAEIACLWEATARKPGNVHRYRDFADSGYVDFLLSAAVVGRVLADPGGHRVGDLVLEGVRQSRQVAATNTNLGILLLLAPLAKAAAGGGVHVGLRPVLDALDVADAVRVYEAIRLANPAGLGRVDEQDVRDEPTRSLREVMALVANRDLVARQYANDFHEVFADGVPALLAGLVETGSLEGAIVACHLRLVSLHADSLIARKRGPDEAAEASRRALQVLAAGWPRTAEGVVALAELDAWLSAAGHGRNPGTTADLIAACLFVALQESSIQLPPRHPWAFGPLAAVLGEGAVLLPSPPLRGRGVGGEGPADRPMAERFKVRVTKDHLVFCSGHFISYEGDRCERLHGHNYRAAVEVEGGLDVNFYVFDFIALKHRTKAITDELDHRMLLATRNPHIHVEEGPRGVHVTYRDREWLFPRDDCVLLPIENTTAELLARYIGQRLAEDLQRQHRYVPEVLRVEVEENVGQSATYEWRPS